MCFNTNYLDKAETMLFSMRMHCKEEITVYLLNHSLKNSECETFSDYLQKKCNISTVVVSMDDTELEQLPTVDDRYTVDMYYRILAQFLLPLDINRILWLDADIIILKDISPFYYQDFEGMQYIVCPDSKYDSFWLREHAQNLGMSEDQIYFNSGVMLMNLSKLCNSTDKNYILSVCVSLKDKLKFPDQDILNYLFSDQVKYADWKKYNYQLVGVDHISENDLKEITILHYTGENKPWNYRQINSASKYWWRVRAKQGHRLERIKRYIQKFLSITNFYFREIRRILYLYYKEICKII